MPSTPTPVASANAFCAEALAFAAFAAARRRDWPLLNQTLAVAVGRARGGDAAYAAVAVFIDDILRSETRLS